MQTRILVVEDEEHILEAIKINLAIEGYEVETATTGTEGLQMSQTQFFNLIILDVMLPGINGFEICENIRLKDSETPILFLTAKDTSHDKINGLKAGADDYLCKPFSLEEFMLRVKVLIKHSLKGKGEEKELSVFKFGNNEINFLTFQATGIDQKPIELTKKEVTLLKLLIDKKNSVVSRQTILQYVWGYDVYPSTRTIDNFILAFRKYFEEDIREPKFFHSIRGVGYKFTDSGI